MTSLRDRAVCSFYSDLNSYIDDVIGIPSIVALLLLGDLECGGMTSLATCILIDVSNFQQWEETIPDGCMQVRLLHKCFMSVKC